MSAGERRTDGSVRLILYWLATIMPFIVTAGLVSDCAGSEPGPAMLAEGAAASVHTKLVFLQPGTLIGDKPPAGWSHLVVKSIPRLATGDKGTLPASSLKTAEMFHTAIVAQVQPVDVEEKEFELTQIGVGICVPKDDDHDQVVTGDSLQALGLKFTTVQRMVLDAAEAELAEGRIIARTPTFALFRGPATVVVPGNEHLRVYVYYAFCVERTTGKLRVGVWTMLPESKPQKAPATMIRLGSKPVYECQLDVKARRILGTVPYSWSFAMRALPPGSPMRVPPALGELIVSAVRHPAESDTEELEHQLITTLSTVTASDKAVRQTAVPPAPRRAQ
jgi:hypothetical protein